MSDLIHSSTSRPAPEGTAGIHAMPTAPADERTAIRPGVTAAVIVMALMVVGGLLRIIAAMVLTPHVDEASSLLAGHAVEERGVPILPSGTVYMQGATLSYVLAPLIRLGFDNLSDLTALRMIVVAAGIATIWFSYRFAHLVTGSQRIGVMMALLVTFDPLSIQWSGHLRMYGVLQVITVGLAFAWTLLLARGWTWKRMAAVVILFWLAVFTHVGASLLGGGMFISALWIYRKSLIRQWKVLTTLALSAAGSLTLMLLNRTLGSASVGDPEQESTSRRFSFVGDNLLTPFANSIDEFDWVALTRGSNLFWLVPGAMVAIATLLGARHLLRSKRRIARIGAIVTLSLYWVPMIGVGLFTNSPKERYVLNSHLLGYLFAAVIVAAAVDRWREARPVTPGVHPLASQVFSIALAVTLVWGGTWRLENPVVHPDHHAAMEYVVMHHQPGEPVIVALPAIGYLAMGEENADDLYFLAGEQNQTRARRYTRYTGDGNLIDYWAGVPALTSPARIETFLAQNPDAWIVVDDHRLTEDWAYAGPIAQVLRDNTSPVATTAGGGVVLRPNATAGIADDILWEQLLDEETGGD